MGNLIIIDRKAKRASSDNNWADPLGVETARQEKARTIEVPRDSVNPMYVFLRDHKPSELVGRKVFCLTDKQDTLSGYIQDIIPPNFVVIRSKGVARIKDVVSIGSID